MKKIVKIVLITVLVALPALGTYVKTTLPNLGSATDPAMDRTAKRIESGKCQDSRIAVSINCNNKCKWSEIADPNTGGLSNLNPENKDDFPVSFLFNAIPLVEEPSARPDIKIEKKNRKYLIAGIL